MKLIVLAMMMVTFSISAVELRPIYCTSRLDYFHYVNGQKTIKTIDLTVFALRTPKNTIRHGVKISAGNLDFKLNLPSVSVSDTSFIVKGGTAVERKRFDLRYFANTDGSQNFVSVSRFDGAHELTATNKILSLNHGELGRYELKCEIVQSLGF